MLIKSASVVVTQNKGREILRDVDILIEGGVIKEIGKDLQGGPIIDGHNKVWLPGLINTHTHIGMHMLRGLCDDEELDVWLSKVSEAESKFSLKDIQDGAKLAAKEMIESGTTCVVENYWPIDPVIEVLKVSPIRALVVPTFADTLVHIRGDMESSIKDVIKKYKDIPHMKLGIGAHSIYTVSKDNLKRLHQVAKEHKIIFTIHLAETRKERVECMKIHGMLPVEYLDSLGVLDENTLIAHAVWLNKSEIRILARRGVKVSHNPISNMKLAGGGVMALPEMHEAGVIVSLGTDSVASNNSMDMFEVMKTTGLIQKHHRWDARTANAQQILDMATIDGAKCIGMEDHIGSIEVGKYADLISISLDQPRMQPQNNIISNLVYAVNGGCVGDVIIGGVVAKRCDAK